MALSYAQLEGLWIQAGGSSALAPVAAAVALAESGGNPTAHNAKPPDDSYGLWQINMYGSLGPSRRNAFGLNSNTQLFDPLTNAKAAVAIGKGGFGPWTTFTSGAYKKYLNGSVPPDLNSIGSGIAGVGGSGGTNATEASLGSDIGNSLSKAFAPMLNTVGNLTAFTFLVGSGTLILLAGVYMLFKETGVVATGSAVKTAVKVVGGPVGKAVVR